jgi:hypothetical protein
VDLRQLACWDCGFESRRGHGCLSLVSGVLLGRGLCDGTVTRREESYRVWCVWVWSWSLTNEEALAHQWLLRHWKNVYTNQQCGNKVTSFRNSVYEDGGGGGHTGKSCWKRGHDQNRFRSTGLTVTNCNPPYSQTPTEHGYFPHVECSCEWMKWAVADSR